MCSMRCRSIGTKGACRRAGEDRTPGGAGVMAYGDVGLVAAGLIGGSERVS